jgi:predicted Zn-dependent protease
MSELAPIVDEILGGVPDGFEAQVVARSSHSGLTRFANSFIHQNVAEETLDVDLTLASADHRVATAKAKVAASGDALRRLVTEAVEAVRVAPVSEEWPGFTPPVPTPTSRPPAAATASATPADRATIVRDFVDAGKGLRSAGYSQTETTRVVYASTTGHRAEGATSAAVLDGIHQTDTSAGSGHSASRDLADLDGAAVGAAAADRARRAQRPSEVAPGEYEVVLGPEAVATIAIFLALYGFNGRQVLEGQSFVALGDQQFDPAFSLVDDGTDSRATRFGFDTEGTPKRRLDLVRAGITTGIAYDRRQAVKAGVESTGHALSFFGEYWGPIPIDLFVLPGDRPVEQVIAGVERGLYVSTFNYVRILDPRTTVATGLTRNGTFLVEAGELTTAVRDLRFTQSLVGALGPGRVLEVASDARFADSEFGPTFVHAPSMRLAGWRFTGGAEG